MWKVILGVIGVLLGILGGAIVSGAGDIFITVVYPHGGWNHVTREMLIKLTIGSTIGALLGGVIGIVLGVMVGAPRHPREGR